MAGPKVVTRRHPRGSKGTKVSVSEIVRKVEQGRLDPKTRAWSIETLHRGNLGGFGADKIEQSRAIFERLKKERIYIEDPVDGEFMQSSACTLDGCDGLMFLGGDCDDLVIAFLSAIESVGIEGALVAHGYDSSRQHTHVLAAIRDPKRERWVRCDPSVNDPFGVVAKPTRETFYGIPGGKVLADGNGLVDVTKVKSALGNNRPSGDFVGVGRPVGVGETPQTANPALEGLSDSFRQYMRDEIARIVADMEAAWNELRYRHQQLVLASEMMNEIAGGGYELVDPEVAEPGEQSKMPQWTKELEAYYRQLEKYMPVMIRYGKEAAAGQRELLWDEGAEYGKKHNLGYDKSSIVVTGRQGEPYVGINTQTGMIMVGTIEDGVGQVGTWLVVAGAAIVVVGAGVAYFAAKEVCDVIKMSVAAKRQEQQERFLAEQSDKYGPDKAKSMLDAINEGAAARAAAKVEEDKVSPFSQVTETASKALNTLVIIGVGAAAIYGVTVAADLFKNRRTKMA